jgi:hypothetical protein
VKLIENFTLYGYFGGVLHFFIELFILNKKDCDYSYIMDIFVVIIFRLCKDPYYGYNEHLHSMYFTYEDAKIFVDTLMKDNKKYDGRTGKPFIRIINMKLGSELKNIFFDSFKYL